MPRLPISLAVAVVLAGLVVAGCVVPGPPSNQTVVSILDARGVGQMPNLLATRQVDGYIAWQPFVEIARESSIGQLVVYSRDLPPERAWQDHPTNVFVARDDFLARNPDISAALVAVTITATAYINDHPDEAAAITADWLVGGANFTYGEISVPSGQVLRNAMPTIAFTTEPSGAWLNGTYRFIDALAGLGLVGGQLAGATDEERGRILFDFGPYRDAREQLAQGRLATPERASTPIGVGYLMAADHAALFVAVKRWEHFDETYGIALRPRDPRQTRPDRCDLIVNGEAVAELRLVTAEAGPGLMQLASTNTIQCSYVGVPPSIAAVDRGTPVRILHPVDTEGSGLVVTSGAPARDWATFVAWARERSAGGDPLTIAVPGTGSIQDVMLRVALGESGLTTS